MADDRSGDVVVRLYEAGGGRANAAVTPGFGATSVAEVDLLERHLATVTWTDGESPSSSARSRSSPSASQRA